MIGELEVLSVGGGHLTLTITEGNKEEAERARQLITDMLKRGYAIFVEKEVGRPLVRVKRFDSKRLVYIIADGPEDQPDAAPGPAKPAPNSKAGRREARLQATRTKATVVGRTAGG